MRGSVTGWLGALALGFGLAVAGQGLAQSVSVPPTVDASGTMVVTPTQVPAADATQADAAALDYAAWAKMADAAEALIADPAATVSDIDALRKQLVDWRSAFLGAQNANSTRIATLRT